MGWMRGKAGACVMAALVGAATMAAFVGARGPAAPVAAPTPAPAGIPEGPAMVGTATRREVPCYVASDREAWLEYARAREAGDDRAAVALLAGDRFLEVENGAWADAVGPPADPRKVRIRDGRHAGADGWVGDAFLMRR